MVKKVEFHFGGKKKAKKNLAKGIAIGTAAGSAIGAITGILLAPKSGKETRQKIKDDAACTINATKKAANSLKSTTLKATETAKTFIGKYKPNTQGECHKEYIEECATECNDTEKIMK